MAAFTSYKIGIAPNVIRADERFDTGFKRLIRKLALNAAPKMRAEAEKMN